MRPESMIETRKILRLTQAELARILGVNTRTPSRWETGVVPIPQPVALLLVAALMSADVRRIMGIVEPADD